MTLVAGLLHGATLIPVQLFPSYLLYDFSSWQGHRLNPKHNNNFMNQMLYHMYTYILYTYIINN